MDGRFRIFADVCTAVSRHTVGRLSNFRLIRR